MSEQNHTPQEGEETRMVQKMPLQDESENIEEEALQEEEEVETISLVKTPYAKLSHDETIDAIEEYLKANYDMKYNDVLGKIEFRKKGEVLFKEIDDYYLNSIMRDIKTNERIAIRSNQLKEVITSDLVPKYDPVKDYFVQLPAWDGITDHIQELIDTVTPVNYKMWFKYFRKWIVAMVGSCVDAKTINQTVLIFIGKQGIGKTTWLTKLVPPLLKRYYYEGSVRANNKEAMIQIAENFLINLDEMDNMMRGDGNAIKQLITQTGINIRRPYTRYSVMLPRRASFTGSLNHKTFLNDPTGNRRYLCFEVNAFDFKHKVDMEKVYAQALHLYRNNFTYWLEEKDIEELSLYNKEFEIVGLEEDAIAATFRPAEPGETPEQYLSATDVLRYISSINRIAINNSTLQLTGKALNKLKFNRVKKGGKYVYELMRIKPQNTKG